MTCEANNATQPAIITTTCSPQGAEGRFVPPPPVSAFCNKGEAFCTLENTNNHNTVIMNHLLVQVNLRQVGCDLRALTHTHQNASLQRIVFQAAC